ARYPSVGTLARAPPVAHCRLLGVRAHRRGWWDGPCSADARSCRGWALGFPMGRGREGTWLYLSVPSRQSPGGLGLARGDGPSTSTTCRKGGRYALWGNAHDFGARRRAEWGCARVASRGRPWPGSLLLRPL